MPLLVLMARQLGIIARLSGAGELKATADLYDKTLTTLQQVCASSVVHTSAEAVLAWCIALATECACTQAAVVSSVHKCQACRRTFSTARQASELFWHLQQSSTT